MSLTRGARALLCLLLVLVATCQPGPAVTTRAPTPTATRTPTPTATWWPTATSTATLTPTASETPAPTSSSTSSPTGTPTPLGTRRFLTPTPEGTLTPGPRGRTVTLSVSVYVPRAGGINGHYGRTASGVWVRRGIAACGPAWPFGTIFLLPAWVQDYDLPRAVVCLDRGGLVSDHHLDVALTGDVVVDLSLARLWGRRLVTCEVNP